MTKDINKIFGEVNYNDKHLDKGIIPLIKEINKFRGIKTFSSCEGNCKNQDYCAYVILGSYDIRTMNDFFKVCNDICWRPKYQSTVK